MPALLCLHLYLQFPLFLIIGPQATTLLHTAAAVATVGTAASQLYNHFTRKPNIALAPIPAKVEPMEIVKPEPVPMEIDKPEPKLEPKTDIASVTTETAQCYSTEELKPYTVEELRKFTLVKQQQMIFERTIAIRNQETAKNIVCDLMKLQTDATHDELDAQRYIDKVDTKTRDMISKGGLGQTVKGSALKPDKTNVSRDPTPKIDVSSDSEQSDDESIDNDKGESQKSKAVVERPTERPADSLKHASSEPKKGTKRVVAEVIAPTDENERPPKRSKSANSKPVPRKNAKQKEKCSNCPREESKLYAKDPRDGKKYCYRCHTQVLNRCSYKPSKGGRPCFNAKEDRSERCSKHPLEQENLSSVIGTSV